MLCFKTTKYFTSAPFSLNCSSFLQKAFDVINISSKDCSNSRKIGLIGILSDAKSLYRKNAFGGATIKNPYDTIEEYKNILENEHNVDLGYFH